MRLYDETCVLLCEGQYIDIATSASDEPMTVDLYFDMIGRKTAALISASIEAGALLATDDEDGHRAATAGSAGRSVSPSSSTTTCSGIWGERAQDRQGADRRRPPQEDAAGPVRLRARRRRPTASGSRELYAGAGARPTAEIVEIVAILERSGAQEFTRAEAQRHRDACLAELDGSTSWMPAARERLGAIIVSVISA